MALDDVKQSIISNVTNAYTKAADKGAAVPENKNLENLATTIDSIVTGITPEGTIEIRENGKYDVTNVAEADVLVTGGLSVGERELSGYNFANSDVYEVLPNFSAGGQLDLTTDVDITDSTVTYEPTAEGYLKFINPNPLNYVEYAKVWFDVPTAGNVIITIYGYCAGGWDKDINLGLGDIDGDANSRYGPPTALDGFTHLSMDNHQSGILTVTYENVPAGRHFVAFKNYGYYNYNRATWLRLVEVPVNSADYDAMTKLTLLKPTTLKPENIKNNVDILGIKGVVKSPAFMVEGGYTSLELNDVSYVGSSVFMSHKTLQSVTFTPCASVYSSAFYSCATLRTVNLPECKNIGSRAFAGCSQLSNINLPQCLSIDQYAFYQCSNLTELNLPNVVILSSYAFGQCSKLSSINIPNVSMVSTGAFASCSLITEFVNDSVQHIAGFANCYSLSRVIAPNCKRISGLAFTSCSKLAEVILPAVTRIDHSSAFLSCGLIKELSFPVLSSLSGYYTFNYCKNLSALILASTSTTWLEYSYAFSYTPIFRSDYLGYYGSVYVPADLVATYQKTSPWSGFKSRITSIEFAPRDYRIVAVSDDGSVLDGIEYTMTHTTDTKLSFAGTLDNGEAFVRTKGGDYTIEVSEVLGYAKPETLTVVLNSSSNTDIVLTYKKLAPSTVRVTLTDVNGNPLADTPVAMLSPAGRVMSTTNGDGVAEILDVAPSTYTVSVPNVIDLKTPEAQTIVVDEGSEYFVDFVYTNVPATSYSSVLSENSFDTIALASENISARQMTATDVENTYGWKIGDTTSFTRTDGSVVEIMIIDVNHDDRSDGLGKAGLTFRTVGNAVQSKYTSESTNHNGYKNSDIRNVALPGQKALMPEDLVKHIKTVDKLCANGGGTAYTGVITLNEELFALSSVEHGGSGKEFSSIVVQGETLEGYKYPGTTYVQASSWLRSVLNGDNNAACIKASNKIGGEHISNNNWLAYAFCI